MNYLKSIRKDSKSSRRKYL